MRNDENYRNKMLVDTNDRAPTQTCNNTAIFSVQTTQYISSTSTDTEIRLAEFEITVCHNTSKKNLHDRTKKQNRLEGVYNRRIGCL